MRTLSAAADGSSATHASSVEEKPRRPQEEWLPLGRTREAKIDGGVSWVGGGGGGGAGSAGGTELTAQHALSPPSPTAPGPCTGRASTGMAHTGSNATGPAAPPEGSDQAGVANPCAPASVWTPPRAGGGGMDDGGTGGGGGGAGGGGGGAGGGGNGAARMIAARRLLSKSDTLESTAAEASSPKSREATVPDRICSSTTARPSLSPSSISSICCSGSSCGSALHRAGWRTSDESAIESTTAAPLSPPHTASNISPAGAVSADASAGEWLSSSA
eukprot:5859820-Prymnesium_polylepis.2